MVSITFTHANGEDRVVEVHAGISLMEAARNNDVPEIVADCGGACSCATCHVYIGGDWPERLPAPSEQEEVMLDFALDRQANSRLSCQIHLTNALDGLRVALPVSQA